jgi:hypothetical protein
VHFVFCGRQRKRPKQKEAKGDSADGSKADWVSLDKNEED